MKGTTTLSNTSTTAYERVLDALRAHRRRVIDKGTTADAQCPAHDDRNPSLTVTGIEGQALVRCHREPSCDTADVMAALGLTMADLFDERRGATYRYDDGRVVHRTPNKVFSQSGNTSGPPQLYHVSRLEGATDGAVFLVEGEKDVHAIEAVGGIATTAPMGAGNFTKVDVSPLRGRYVTAVVDRDAGGDRWAAAVRTALHGVAAKVRFVHAEVGCKDAADHVGAGHGLDRWVPYEWPEEASDTGPPQDEPPTLGDIWDQRPSLAFIRDAARAGRAGPYAVLGAVLARVIAATPPTVVLPKVVGGYGSLNLYVALVGHSGQGKGSAQRIAADIVPDAAFTEAGVGSGEGIAHLYVRRTRANGGEVEQHTTAALIDVPEIDTLTALGDRRGATLLPELRKAWVGEALGFAYADPSKRLPVRGHAYRLSLIAGVQPGRGGTLLGDADGGTPQRFLWLPVIDPDAPDEVPAEPEPWEWKPPQWGWTDQRVILPVCESAKAQIDADRLVRLRGHTPRDDLNAHALMARLKIAAALAILDGRAAVTDDDWSIAATIMEISTRTRDSIAAELRHAASQRNKARGAAEAERAVVVEEQTQEAAIRRVCKTITRKLAAQGDTSTPHNKLRSSIAARDRELFEPAIDRLVEAGQIEVDPAGRGLSYRLSGSAR